MKPFDSVRPKDPVAIATAELRAAQTEMRRSLAALRLKACLLEVPDAVWADVNRHAARLWDAAWGAVDAAKGARAE